MNGGIDPAIERKAGLTRLSNRGKSLSDRDSDGCCIPTTFTLSMG